MNKTIYGAKCIVAVMKNRVEISMCTGSKQRFNGKTNAEAELQLWNYLHMKPKMRGEAAVNEEEIKSLLSTLDMPKEHVKVNSGHYKQHAIYGKSYTVRRSIGTEGKIYFGTYHNEHAAKAASIRLCELINEEIDRRHFVRKTLVDVNVDLFNNPYGRGINGNIITPDEKLSFGCKRGRRQTEAMASSGTGRQTIKKQAW